MGHDVWQPPPLADGQAGGHFHQPLDEVELLLFWVADGQVASVHVHLPCHLLRTAQLHLVIEKTRFNAKLNNLLLVWQWRAFGREFFFFS